MTAASVTPAMLAKLETLLGERRDRENRALRWSDLQGLRKSLIDSGGAGALDAPDSGTAPAVPPGGTIGGALAARLKRAEKEIDAAEAAASEARDKALNALAALHGAGTVVRTANMVTLPDGSQAAGIEAWAWDDNGNGSGSAMMLHGQQVIAPGTLSANEFVAGFGNNLCQNSRFYDGMTHWMKSGGAAETTFEVRKPGQPYAHPSFATLVLAQSGVASDQASLLYRPQQDGTTTRIVGAPAEPGKWYGASAYLRTEGCTAQVRVVFYNAAGTALETQGSVLMQHTAGSTDSPDGWSRPFIKRLAPANTRFVSIELRKASTLTGSTSSLVAMWKPQIEETTVASVQPAAYSSGEVGLFTGDMMFSRNIFGRHLTVTEAVITETIQMKNAVVGTLTIAGFAVTDDTTLLSSASVTGSGYGTWKTHSQIAVVVPNDGTRIDLLCNVRTALDSGNVQGDPWALQVVLVKTGAVAPGTDFYSNIHSSYTPLMGYLLLDAGTYTFRLSVSVRSGQTVNQAYWKISQRKR